MLFYTIFLVCSGEYTLSYIYSYICRGGGRVKGDSARVKGDSGRVNGVGGERQGEGAAAG